MASVYPTAIDTFIDWIDGTSTPEAFTINDIHAAVLALEAKVGVNSSAVAASHDYKLAKPIARGYAEDVLTGGLAATLTTSTASFSKIITRPDGLKELMGYQKRVAGTGLVETIDISSASFTAIFSLDFNAYDTTTTQDAGLEFSALTLNQLTVKTAYGIIRIDGTMYRIVGR